jgi:hypothetical protein
MIAVRKPTVFLTVIILGFLSASLVESNSVQAQYADDGRLFPLASPINIASPSNSTYNSGLLILDISFKLMLNVEKTNITVLYSLDGKENVTVPWSAECFPVESTVTYPNGSTLTDISSLFSYYIISACVALPELPEGFHSISVYGRYEHAGGSNYNVHDSSKVCFTINKGNAPVISILSVENKTYSQDRLDLNFTVDKSTSWMGYCLDGQANVTLTGNFTLTQLPIGSHTLTVYANDTVGNMGSSLTINFNVAEPFPTLFVVAVTATIVAVVVIGVLIYLKKQSNRSSRGKRQDGVVEV